MNTVKKVALALSGTLLLTSFATGQERRFLPGPAEGADLPQQGSHEITFGGVGQSDRRLNNGRLSLEGSWGWYTTDRVLISVRQTINSLGSRSDWNGATAVAADYHFLDGAWRPFLGVNAGFRYGGRSVGDSFSAGAQAGVKYYLQGNAFLFGRADYSYTFDRVRDVDDAWDKGRFGYAFGVGLNF